ARASRVRRWRVVDRGRWKHQRDGHQRRAGTRPRAAPVRRRACDRPRRTALGAVIRAWGAVPPSPRARFTELSLLVWVAALAVTGFVAVVGAETSAFGPASCIVPSVHLALLLSPLFPLIGREINGARIWIKIGPGSIEPWEAVKLLLVVFFAAYLEEYREVLTQTPRRIGPLPVPPVPYLVPIVAMWGVAML